MNYPTLLPKFPESAFSAYRKLEIRLKAVLIILLMIVAGFSTLLSAQPLAGTDDLGRTLPQNATVGDPKANKTVAIFYFLWQGDGIYTPHHDIGETVANNPAVLNDYSSPDWGPVSGQTFYYWGQSIYNYFKGNDYWVHLKNVQLLTDAGVDILVLDYTNALIYPEQTRVLMQAIAAVQAQGKNPPKISAYTFLNSGATMQAVYDTYFDPANGPVQTGVWFELDGKPLIIGKGDEANEFCKSAFTIKESQWPTVHPANPNTWPWIDFYRPQQVYSEITPVSPAQHAVGSMGSSAFYGRQGNFGRSYHNGSNGNPSIETPYGFNFQEQWDEAILRDLPFIFVTGWNEWVVGRSRGSADPLSPLYNHSSFEDLASPEFSRDIEPSLTGNLKDNYYMQMVSNIRKYKGIGSNFLVSSATITSMTDWSSVTEIYSDYTGDTYQRNAIGGLTEVIDADLLTGSGRFEYPGIDNFFTDGILRSPIQGAVWTFSSTHSGMFTNGFGIAQDAGEGSQGAFLEGTDGYFEKSVNFEEGHYVLSFQAIPYLVSTYTAFKVYLDQQPVDSFDSRALALEWTPSYKRYSRDITATAGLHTIKFVSTSPTEGNTSLIDDISIKKLEHNHYTNTTGRNDFDKLKVAYDDNNAYFYAKTVTSITPNASDNWMNLYLDTDKSAATGWKGYDYRIIAGTKLQRWNNSTGLWDNHTEVAATISDNEMYYTITKTDLGLTQAMVNLEFKWSDNMQNDTDPLDWYINGDAAPGGRFSFVATNIMVTEEGNFETPALANASFQYRPSSSSWLYTGASGIARNGSAFNNPNAPEGYQVGFIQSAGSIKREVNLSTESWYKIDFRASPRQTQTTQTIKIYFDEKLIGTVKPTTPGFQPYSSYTFKATAGNHNIKFEGQNATQDVTAFIDDVKIRTTITPNDARHFETPVLANGGYEYLGNAGILAPGEWTFNSAPGFGSGIASNGSAFNNPNAPEGKQVAFIQNGSSMYKDFNFQTDGRYQIHCWSSRRPGSTPVQTLNVYCNNQLVGTISPATTNFQLYSTPVFNMTAGMHQVKFVGQNATQDATAFVDYVTVINMTPLDEEGGFESPVLANGSYEKPAADPDGWDYGIEGIYANSGIARNGNSLNNPDAPEGSQVAFIKNEAWLMREFEFDTDGWYKIDLHAAQKANDTRGPRFSIYVVGDDTYFLVDTISPTTTNFQLYSTRDFFVKAGVYKIFFDGAIVPVPVGDATAFIDDIKVIFTGNRNEGGFENPILPASSYNYLGGVEAWKTHGWIFTGQTGNGSGIASNGSWFYNPIAPEGRQTAFIQKAGSVSKDFDFATDGWYKINFKGSQRPNFTTVQTLKLYSDDKLIGTFIPTTRDFQTYTSYAFYITAGTHQVKFVGQNATQDATVFIDDVKISSSAAPGDDAGFETPVLITGAYENLNNSALLVPHGWTYSSQPGSGSGIARNGSLFNNPNAPEGSQVGFIQKAGSINKDFNFPQPGVYKIEFKASQRPGYTAVQTLNMDHNGKFIGSIIPSTSNFQLYSTNTFHVIGIGTNQKIRFSGQNVNQDATAFIDDVKVVFVTSLPEGGFEKPVIIVDGQPRASYDNSVTGSEAGGWLFQGNGQASSGSGIARNGCSLSPPVALEGSQAGYLQCLGSISGNFLLAEGAFKINFLAAQSDMTRSQTIKIYCDGNLIGTISPTTAVNYQVYSSSIFNVTTGVHQIKFAGQNATLNSLAYIDDVQIAEANVGSRGITPSITTLPLQVKPPTPVLEELPKEISLYPNPVSDVLNINCTVSDPTIEIHDLNGRLVSRRRYSASKVSIDVRHWGDGVYIARIIEGKKVSYKKFIVAKE